MVSIFESFKELQIPYMKKRMAALNRTVSIFFRTMNPGHHSCDEHVEPFKNVNDFRLVPNDEDKYHWNLHIEFDQLAQFYKSILNISVINMKPLYLRPDAHPGRGDCLHFCTPGPLDLFPRLLQNELSVELFNTKKGK